MLLGDAAPADAVCRTVLFGGPPADAVSRAWIARRMAHLIATDPAGCWVAEAGGVLVGVAMAFVREGLWGLSLFAVAEHHQGAGTGRRLLDATLAHADGADRAVIMSTSHPAAMRLYARAGFALRPSVSAAGVLERRHRPAPDPEVRVSGPEEDEAVGALGRVVRGASYARELPTWRDSGHEVLALADRGLLVRMGGVIKLLAATDDESARRLLRGALARCPVGATIMIDVITAENDWAVGVCLDAGLALSPDGPLFVRGDVGPLRPFLPSGAYL